MLYLIKNRYSKIALENYRSLFKLKSNSIYILENHISRKRCVFGVLLDLPKKVIVILENIQIKI
jgi:hypothetical protein